MKRYLRCVCRSDSKRFEIANHGEAYRAASQGSLGEVVIDIQ
jgi:hypothetical protein